MQTTDLEEIRRVLRAIRERAYPQFPVGFCDAVLEAEAGAGDDDKAAELAIRAAAERTLAGEETQS